MNRSACRSTMATGHTRQPLAPRYPSATAPDPVSNRANIQREAEKENARPECATIVKKQLAQRASSQQNVQPTGDREAQVTERERLVAQREKRVDEKSRTLEEKFMDFEVKEMRVKERLRALNER